MNKFINDLFIILLGTFILTLVSFYNGYPLVYSDTGTYLYSGFDQFVPIDRPITYGLFVYVFSMKISLWVVVFTQNFITSLVVYKICQFLIGKEKLPLYFLCLTTFLTLLTGIGWYSNQITPDFFAPIFLLILFLLLYNPKIGTASFFLFSVLFIFSLVVHFSHLLIAVVMIITILTVEFWIVKKWRLHTHVFPLKRGIIIMGLIASSWIILPSINYLTEKKFVLSKSSHAFLMAHLVDSGLLEKFLNENCSKAEFKDCKLCYYKDSLPNDAAAFLWEPNGVFHKTGGWLESKNEYDRIIHEMLTSPKYLALNLSKSFTYGCIQLCRNEIGQGLSAYNEGSAPYGQIHWRFHDELSNYLNSKQNLWNGINLNLKSLNLFNLLLNMISFFCLLIIFLTPLWRQINILTLRFLIYSLLAIIINAFFTAGINLPCERLQARVVWLLPLALSFIVIANFQEIKRWVTISAKNN